MEKDAFRKYGHEFVDWVVDYLENVGKYPVRARVKPGEIANQIPDSAPQEGEPMKAIFEDFEKIVLPGMTHWQHPSWFAYFPANSSPPSILAEILTAGMGAQCMIWETSPSAAELEERVLGWLRQMLGLPEGMDGVIQDTASTASLVALLTARERATGFKSNSEGLREKLTAYISEEAHSSVEKGAKIAGYGKDNLRQIPTDTSFAMIPGKLEEAVIADKKRGFKPACAVATVGTTSSGAIDPLVPIGMICRKHGLFLHVDAAYAGTAAILPEKRWIIEGSEYADSFVFNPHKWMLTNFDCSAYFVKDAGDLIRTFEIHPEYLKTGVDSLVKNYRDWGIQLGRRFRALKLWFVLRYYGVAGIQKMVREHIRMADMFREWVEAHPSFELMAPVHLSLVCFRINDGRSEDVLTRLNKDLIERINQTGQLLLTHTVLKGKFVLRMAIAARATKENHIRQAWRIIREAAEDLLKTD
ncbi:MAG: aspartate aminotransferase family protein [Candidatus Aminicenantes bacterium]|nr:aspartate aminotransferase family protein [Candidatus Aminicenantes bacterium]